MKKKKNHLIIKKKNNHKKQDTLQSPSIVNKNCKHEIQFKPPGLTQFTALLPQVIQKQLNLSQSITIIDAAQLTYLMYYVLNFPSLDDAENHKLANRLGCYDIDKTIDKNRSYCKCCGFVKQEKQIPICTSFTTFPNVGISTYLFFQTIKNLILLLLLVTATHSIYSITTNIKVTNLMNDSGFIISSNIYQLLTSISLSWKQNAIKLHRFQSFSLFYMAEMWIGVVIVILWSLLLYLIKYYERKYEAMVNLGTISAADFSIIIENYPQNMSIQQLQYQFNAYADKLKEQNCGRQDYFHIQKISLSADSSLKRVDQQQMKGIHRKYVEMLEMFAQWISNYEVVYSLPYNSKKRYQIYEKFQKVKKERFIKGRKLLHVMYNKNQTGQNLDENLINSHERQVENKKKQKGKTIAIVTFKYSNTKDLIARYNCLDIAKRIRYILSCCPSQNKFILLDQITNLPIKNIKISKAPQPQDIKWENLSVSRCQKLIRRLFTYFVTLLLLGASFVFVYGLENLQMTYENNFYISLTISITISLINFTIGFLIRFVTVFQKDYTETAYQSSLAIKSIWAQLLNSIVIPFMANYIIQDKNVYGKNGLSSDVIYLSLTSSFLPVLNKFFDPYYQYTQIKAFYYRKALKKRLLMKQDELNDTQQLMEFQTGYEYIYFINLYLFTAYFVTLQPCISVFAIIGMGMMYWIHKYSLFNRVQRPVPGTDLVNTAMGQMVSLGPIFFALGALTWSHFLQGYKIQQYLTFYYLPNIIAGGLAALFFIFPFSIIFDRCLPKEVEQNLDYSTCRILLTSEYDRTNPATMEKAIRQYKEYVGSYVMPQEKNEGPNYDKIETCNNTLNVVNIISKQPCSINSGEQMKTQTAQSMHKDLASYVIIDEQHHEVSSVNSLIKQKIDRQFLFRKKEVLENNIRRKSKMGKGRVADIVAEFVGQKSINMKEGENQNEAIGDQLVDEDSNDIKQQGQQGQQPEFNNSGNALIKTNHQQISNTLSKSINNKKKDSSQDIDKKIIEIRPKRYLTEKQCIIKSHHKGKQINYRESAMQRKFNKILPVKQSNQDININTPKNVEDINYINYFDIKNKYKIHQIYHQNFDNNQGTPYDKIFH